LATRAIAMGRFRPSRSRSDFLAPARVSSICSSRGCASTGKSPACPSKIPPSGTSSKSSCRERSRTSASPGRSASTPLTMGGRSDLAWSEPSRTGEVVRELFQAKNARDRALRERFDQVRSFMASALHRGLCDVFLDPDTQRLELREALPEPNPLGLDIRIDRGGSWGRPALRHHRPRILLAGGRLVAIEEPEAHLHAPSTGRELRALLQGMVREGRVDQIFIATHSNLFDLDPTGYWDVSLESETGETRVDRKDLGRDRCATPL